MENSDWKEFLKIMMILSEVYDKELSKEFIELYFRILKDMKIKEIQENIMILLKTRKYSSFPTPAEIRQPIENEEEGMLKWIQVKKAIEKYGAYESIIFKDPFIHSAIEHMGGWIELCSVKEEEMKWKEKEFIRLYSIMKKNNILPSNKYLIGIIEQENVAKGYDKKFIQQITNKIKQLKGKIKNE